MISDYSFLKLKQRGSNMVLLISSIDVSPMLRALAINSSSESSVKSPTV